MIAISLLVALSLLQSPAAAQSGHISGRITVEGTNAPIADAQVMLIPVTRTAGPIGPPPQTTTDQDGRYQFDDVAPGAYRINIQKTGFAPEMGVPGQPPSQMVRVGDGQSVSVDRQLQKGAVISGRILGANGEPMPDVQMMAMRRVAAGRGNPARLMPAPGRSQQTNDLGEFRISGLPAGEYVVAAMPNPMRTSGGRSSSAGPRTTVVRTFYPGTADEAAAAPVAVTAGAEVGNISFVMQSAAAFRVSGVVVDADGNVVGNAMVMLTGDGTAGNFGPGHNARTGADGRFVIADVPAGSYRAHATPMNASGSGLIGAPPPPIVVTDADVTGLTVVTPRLTPR